MCGIAGIVDFSGRVDPALEPEVSRMLGSIRHRGPDQFGIYTDECAGIGSARLSVVDLQGGGQPISNEDGSLWIVFNGEIFNYAELRPHLRSRGHVFTTNTDTEVILHLFEEYGAECLAMLNGQFAIAIWNQGNRTLFLGRDRLGVRPLYYTLARDRLIFASEIKALLNVTGSGEIDPLALDEIFTFWSTLAPRTTFRNILELPPGHFLTMKNGGLLLSRYWQLKFPSEPPAPLSAREEDDRYQEFRDLLADAIRIRLRADVPVGAYLSGGLDSSVIAAMALENGGSRLETFSIAFANREFDESAFQEQVAADLGTTHHTVRVSDSDVAAVFPDVIWHTEAPVLRSAPAPMFLLSRRVHDQGLKVVLTGEGADEFLAGYDIFKEAAIRRFWSRQPKSTSRPLLLKRLYPDINGVRSAPFNFLQAFFKEGLLDTASPSYSHSIRWKNTMRGKRFFSAALQDAIGPERDCLSEIRYPDEFARWAPLAKAAFLEALIFLPQYLLSAQGDRVAMANSVEGRFPYLDFRVVEFCNRLPSNLKLRGLTEKHLLRRLGRELLPESIWRRRKRPYRAPIHQAFLQGGLPEYAQDLLTPANLASAGYFNPRTVSGLMKRAREPGGLGETDDMALAGILSTQLVHNLFVSGFRKSAPLSPPDKVKICGPAAADASEYSTRKVS